MNRVDRLLALILYLQSRPLCTGEEMAEHFGRSLRTIYRDLERPKTSDFTLTFSDYYSNRSRA
jgi:predicted DNA-binding transcriptional regulator YafY